MEIELLNSVTMWAFWLAVCACLISLVATAATAAFSYMQQRIAKHEYNYRLYIEKREIIADFDSMLVIVNKQTDGGALTQTTIDMLLCSGTKIWIFGNKTEEKYRALCIVLEQDSASFSAAEHMRYAKETQKHLKGIVELMKEETRKLIG